MLAGASGAEPGKLYWSSNSKIWQANPDGSNIEKVVDSTWTAEHIAVDPYHRKVYWSQYNMWGGSLWSANLDGTNMQSLEFADGWVRDLDVDPLRGHIYYSSLRKIQRANLDGSAVEDVVVFSEDDNPSGPTGMLVDWEGGKLYWADDWNWKIRRANLDGSGIEDLVDTPSSVRGQGLRQIALDSSAGKIYWTDWSRDGVYRADVSGSNVERIVAIIYPDYHPTGIALDKAAGKVLWTTVKPGTLQCANLDGSAIEDLFGGVGGRDLYIPRKPAPPQQPRGHTPPAPTPTIDRLGKWTGSTFEAVTADSITSENVHVLVHGWGPGLRDEADAGKQAWDDGVEGADKWKALAASIAARDAGSVVLMYNWLDDSATVTSLSDNSNKALSEAKQSRWKTDINGVRLSDALAAACDLKGTFSGKLHLVGHSHGARVATEAALELQRNGVSVEHLTLLDSPDRALNWFMRGADNQLDNELAKLDYGRESGKTFIENYYSLLGGKYIDQFGHIVNIQLKPIDGWIAPGESHDYPKPWYGKANISGSGEIGLAWSPLLGTYYQGLDNHYVQDWEVAPGVFDSFRELVLRSETETIGPDYREKYSLGYLSLLTEGDVVTTATGATLTEHSPAYWDLLFTKGADDISLEFEYQFLSGGDGDELGIWIDGELRFLMSGYLVGSDNYNSIIDISDLNSGAHVMTVALHSYGETNASVYVGEFTVVAVPEPASLLLMIFGGLAPLRRKRK